MTPIYKVWEALTEKLPTALQESYDNCGLQVGDPSQIATGVLCCVDITEAAPPAISSAAYAWRYATTSRSMLLTPMPTMRTVG